MKLSSIVAYKMLKRIELVDDDNRAPVLTLFAMAQALFCKINGGKSGN